MKYQPELARLLQPAAEVEGPDPVFVHEFEVAIVVASRYRVRYVHILENGKTVAFMKLHRLRNLQLRQFKTVAP